MSCSLQFLTLKSIVLFKLHFNCLNSGVFFPTLIIIHVFLNKRRKSQVAVCINITYSVYNCLYYSNEKIREKRKFFGVLVVFFSIGFLLFYFFYTQHEND